MTKLNASRMKRYTEIRPVVMEDFPDAHNVYLQVANQSFLVSAYACETRGDAEWLRNMLCVALAQIVMTEGSGAADEIERLRAAPVAALMRIKNRIDIRLNDHLCGMECGYDDSIVGFNEAWDLVRAILKEELAIHEKAAEV
jgi:hypothetical protein